jgi:signal transduction histidine kinase
MSADFAGQASIALELLKTKKGQQALALADDRGRIARDLHDHVIQQLFGAGLELNSVAGALGSAPLASRVKDTASRLDDAIAQIRTAIFALTPTAGDASESIRHHLIDLVTEFVPAFASSPTLTFSGPVDLAVDALLAGDVLAVAREALTNAARHANASAATLSLGVTDDFLVVEVSDNGTGITGTRRSGLANLQERAEARAGTCAIETGPTGTVVRWRVPLAIEGAA